MLTIAYLHLTWATSHHVCMQLVQILPSSANNLRRPAVVVWSRVPSEGWLGLIGTRVLIYIGHVHIWIGRIVVGGTDGGGRGGFVFAVRLSLLSLFLPFLCGVCANLAQIHPHPHDDVSDEREKVLDTSPLCNLRFALL